MVVVVEAVVATRGRGTGGRGSAEEGGVRAASKSKSNPSGSSVEPSWQKSRSRRSEETSAQ